MDRNLHEGSSFTLAVVLPAIVFGLTVPAGAITSADIVSATGIDAGLCIYAGCDDGSVAAGLAALGTFSVHCLTTDNATLTRVRNEIASSGTYGLASAERATSLAPLPYMANLANVVVADLDALANQGLTMGEVMRVVAPYGAAYCRQGGSWEATRKALPADMDEWRHGWDGSPDNNPVSRDKAASWPNAVKWVSFYRSQGATMNTPGYSFSIGEGKTFTPIRFSWNNESQWLCRDAFNGILLWRKLVYRNPRHQNLRAPVFANGRYYTVDSTSGNGPVLAVDPATGKNLTKYTSSSTKPSQLRFYNDMVIQAAGNEILFLDPNSDNLLWRYTHPSTGNFFLPACGDNKLFAGFTPTNPGYGDGTMVVIRRLRVPVKSVVCLDLTSRSKVWDKPTPDSLMSNLIYDNGGLYFYAIVRDGRDAGIKYTVGKIDAATGNTVWAKRAETPDTPPAVQLKDDQFQSMAVRANEVALLGTTSYKFFDKATGAGS